MDCVGDTRSEFGLPASEITDDEVRMLLTKLYKYIDWIDWPLGYLLTKSLMILQMYGKKVKLHECSSQSICSAIGLPLTASNNEGSELKISKDSLLSLV